VYQRLTEAADVLAQLEPHSPVPYLIRKAVEFGSLPFPQLMRALIREEQVISEMNRELGIKEPTPEG
jgi:type VI secretion system protein ImpA